MGKRDFYDPYTMAVKDIKELADECRKAIHAKLPGTNKMTHAALNALGQAWEIYSMAHKVVVEHAEGTDPPDSFIWIKHGEHYAAAMIIRKIADGLGISNFKLREVPLEQPTVPGAEPGGLPGPGEADQPG